jgi:hypothetical protein
MRWAGHIPHMGETRNEDKHLWLENSIGRNHLGDRDILTKECQYIKWIELAQNKANGRLSKTVIHL